jgi:hypothetical protein
MPDYGSDQTPPRAAAIFESLRAFGYDLPTALADLVDNSISAGASHIDIHCEWAGANSIIRVIDDGSGMDDVSLVEAMRLGGSGPLAVRAQHDLGRFGLGLKTASLSQCRRLTVRTRRTTSPVATRRWDLDALDDWALHRDATSAGEAWLAPLANMPHGTVVLWENLDRLTQGQDAQNEKHQHRFLERIEIARRHLGMVFHRRLVGPAAVTLRINCHPVAPWDPFMTAHGPQVPCNERLHLDGETISVRGYILPHASRLSTSELAEGGGPRGWLSQQGFYVYRRDRLLVAGDWLGLGWRKDAHFQLLRIALDLPNTLDHVWQINVVKSRAIPPPAIRERLREIAAILRDRAKKVYTHRGARLTAPADSGRIDRLWLHLAKRDRLFYRINTDHPLVLRALARSTDKPALRSLLAFIQETIPLQHIGIAAAEDPSSQPDPFDGAPPAHVKEVLVELYRSFRACGRNHEEAIERLSSHPPCDQFPALLAAIAKNPPDA